MAEQRRLLPSIEHPRCQLSKVCSESLVGGSLWIDHRETTTKSAVGDGCFRVG
jgi:hypothetical protein